MNQEIHISVYLTRESGSPCFERITFTEADNFDYQLVINALFELFGKKCIIKFDVLL